MTDEDYSRTTTLTRLSDAGAILYRIAPENEREEVMLSKVTRALKELQEDVFEKITKGKEESHK